MDWIWTVAGALVIVVGLNEVFHTLLHPTGRGRFTHFAGNMAWRLSSRLGRRTRSVAGPMAAVAVVLLWAGFQIVGWTLVYLPHVPDDFAYPTDIRPDAYPHLVEAFYFSLVTMSTLGLGDVYPVEPVLRIVAPFQALIGFGLLTAAVSWFIELFPGLARHRALALRIALLDRANTAGELSQMEPTRAAALLDALTTDLVQARVDLWQNAELYYFTEDDRDTSLAAQLPYALGVARSARRSADGTVRHSGHLLEAAVDDFAGILRQQYIPNVDGTDPILREYARQHRQLTPPEGTGAQATEGSA